MGVPFFRGPQNEWFSLWLPVNNLQKEEGVRSKIDTMQMDLFPSPPFGCGRFRGVFPIPKVLGFPPTAMAYLRVS